MEIKKGNVIKSHDFHFNTKCYDVGLVEDVDDTFIYYTCIAQYWDDELVDPSEYEKDKRTPHMGMFNMDKKFERIVIIS